MHHRLVGHKVEEHFAEESHMKEKAVQMVKNTPESTVVLVLMTVQLLGQK